MKDELSILTLGAAKSAGGGGGTGDGDMKKAVYDSNDDGIVDAADNAAKVGGHTVAKDVPADAKFTDTVYDDTALSGRVTAIENVVPSDATTSNKLATQSDLPSAVVGNPEGSATAGNLTKLQIGSDIYDVPSGGGSSDPYDGRKTRYTISASSWSSSPNSDGYYTYSLTLTNPLTTSTSPNVYIAGSTDNTEPTATEKTMFGYVKRCNLSSTTTLVLYASTKPTSNFYVFVGAEGGGSNLIPLKNIANRVGLANGWPAVTFSIGTRTTSGDINVAFDYNTSVPYQNYKVQFTLPVDACLFLYVLNAGTSSSKGQLHFLVDNVGVNDEIGIDLSTQYSGIRTFMLNVGAGQVVTIYSNDDVQFKLWSDSYYIPI